MSFELKFTNVGMARGQQFLFTELSFDISEKDILWIQGANGIGKTTLLRLAAGRMRPMEGQITWHKNSTPCQAHDIVAFQPHKDAFEMSFKTLESLKFWANLYKYQGDIEAVLEQVSLTHRAHIAVGSLSAGQRRRLSLARLRVSGRPVWIMDEPMAVMDEAGVALTQNLIAGHTQSGGSVIIASHMPATVLSSQCRRLTLEAAQ